jgi:DNA-binding PadR family transcriptional regulator
MTRDMLNDLLKAGLVRRDGVENERKVTIFRLTGDGKARA